MEQRSSPASNLHASPSFATRHIGPTEADVALMLQALGQPSLDALVKLTLPASIVSDQALKLPKAASERDALAELTAIAKQNRVQTSLIGLGYHEADMPAVIRRGVLENASWYTAYTPYQPEISQGRLEALLNYQTVVTELTGLPLANASLLDEGSAAAEALGIAVAAGRGKNLKVFAAADCHPQTLAVVKTRAKLAGWTLTVAPVSELKPEAKYAGVLLQYPNTDGLIEDPEALVTALHANKSLVVVATDPLALTLLRPPGEFGADVAVGSMQRFGCPLGGGGPHAAFMAIQEAHKRIMPGRLIGVSKDADGKPAYRLALQTREQHIRRDKATSNICTAQALLAVLASFYAVHHGPDGLRTIARRVRALSLMLAEGLRKLGFKPRAGLFFDTLRIELEPEASQAIADRAEAAGINLRRFEGGDLGISLNETSTEALLEQLWTIFKDGDPGFTAESLRAAGEAALPAPHARQSEFMAQAVFHQHRSEQALTRYMHLLATKDLALDTAMIPLGSCTMKLNAAAEMLTLTWPEFAGVHPFAPADQLQGYSTLIAMLETWIAEITGFDATCLAPPSGAHGEFTGLLTIRAYHEAEGQSARNICLIPSSAHGTNPASAVMAGLRPVVVACDADGNVDVADLQAKAEAHKDKLAALMITYPSTHGVFEPEIVKICQIIHDNGGQVYLDGANLNAMVGLARPGDIGADVCHLNLHKSFAMPHGGGGPGVGPISVKAHLAPHLPGHPMHPSEHKRGGEVVASSPFGSANIFPITWMYIRMMGPQGLRRATEVAILSANYMAAKLKGAFPVLYSGKTGYVAHEFILDTRIAKAEAGIEVDDIAKRLMDFGFHAPTMSFPVPGTMMVEPTESEPKAELDRFIEAMLVIKSEIDAVKAGELDAEDNPLKGAPHPAQRLMSGAFGSAYSREQAAYPVASLKEAKYWPPVGRVDNAWGDRNLMCTCPTVEELAALGDD